MAKKDKPKKEVKEKKDSFSIKKNMLKFFILLLSAPLHSEKARARNKVLKVVEEEFNNFDAERIELIKQYGKKDADGELVRDEEKKTYILEDSKGFDTAFKLLENEEVVFDVLPSNREHWKMMIEVIDKTSIEMDPEATDTWEEIISALKSI